MKALGIFTQHISLDKVASILVGDGQEPNLYFVSVDNYVGYLKEGNHLDYKLLNHESDTSFVVRIFKEKAEAIIFANDIELSSDLGEIKSVTIEDRMEGEIYHRHLTEDNKPRYYEEQLY